MKKSNATEMPPSKPAPSELARRAKSAPNDHWTISNRLPIRVGDEIVLMQHNVKIIEILREEDCYREVVVEVLGPVKVKEGIIVPPLRYANA